MSLYPVEVGDKDEGELLYDPDAREQAQYLKLRQGAQALLGVNDELDDSQIVIKIRAQAGLAPIESWNQTDKAVLSVFQSHLVRILSESGIDTSRIAVNRAEAFEFDTLEQRRILFMLSELMNGK